MRPRMRRCPIHIPVAPEMASERIQIARGWALFWEAIAPTTRLLEKASVLRQAYLGQLEEGVADQQHDEQQPRNRRNTVSKLEQRN